ncbi:MFS transporter [Burkholderia seminalis]|uniref:MFS transporter n=1 Tax=Burkholderia seminalis TaxID=488731 RepID=UPI00084F2F5B|nr:MFS transporter [Burkholderia seminalis]MBJ9593788.1 MFS transporter [Burkholderia seminalis]MCA8427902.1 MFS transporter [Burkholderia seminalis]MCA8434951.1 MFS transporter [Burkholderia seminalis]VWC26705.1 MFS transporter [Burkholderia seminalis]
MSASIRNTIDESPMSVFQTMAVTACVVLNMLDGFDVLAIAFAAPHLAAEWKLSGKEIGLLLSAGLAGMGIGSVLIAPLADRVGRRRIILLCLTVISTGMLACAATHSTLQLAVARAYTGLGIGGMLASLTVISGEYASNKWRSAAIGMQSTGYAIGATAGGVVAGYLLSTWGWRSVFAFGGILTLLAIPMVLAMLPESLDFLLARRPDDALRKINRILARMKRSPIAALPPSSIDTASPASGWTAVLRAPLARRTIALWIAFFLVMGSFYFVVSWTPKLLVQAGLSTSQGVTGGVLLNLGGIAGASLFSLLSTRFGLRNLLAATLLLGGALMVVFGANTGSLGIGMIVAVFLGAVINACVAGMYALSPTPYPAEIRTTGIGLAVGIGRLGAILSPMTVGALLDDGWSVSHLYLAFLVPMAGAAIAVAVAGTRAAAPRRQRDPALS